MNNINQDLVILDIEEVEKDSAQSDYAKFLKELFTPGASMSLRQKVIFFRILATMVNASLTVLKSLVSLKKQEKDQNMIKFYNFMIEHIQ